MLIRLLLMTLTALGGAGLTIQMAWNSRLRTATGSPVLATMISLIVSLLCLAVVWASGATNRGSLPEANSLPKWAWLGGIFAAYYLLASLITLPKLGATMVFASVIVGQMMAALVLDTTGAFDVTKIPFTASRALGVAFLLVGVFILQRK